MALSTTPPGNHQRIKTVVLITLFKLSLRVFAFSFMLSKRMRKEIVNDRTGFVFNARYQFATRDGSVNVFMIFDNGRVKSGTGRIDNPDVTIFYKDRETLARLFGKSPEESLDYLLTNEMSYTGNMTYLTKFTYMSTLIGQLFKKTSPPALESATDTPVMIDIDAGQKSRQITNEILDEKTDRVMYLEDAFLGRYRLDDFPRLKYLKNRRFSLKPTICIERAHLMTRFFREHGFEADSAGVPLDPGLRQAGAMRYVMSNKKPIIHDQHLLAGATTAKEVGVPVYPEFIGTIIWPELDTIGNRELNPNDLSSMDADILNSEVFPFWMDRNVREYCRKQNGNPLSQQLEERFVLYFMMKNNAISHTIPDFETIITKGMTSIRDKARQKKKAGVSKEKTDFYRSIEIVVDGVLAYARNLADEAEQRADILDADTPEQTSRAAELREIARICRKVPAQPAQTVHEAVMAIWIAFTCLHLENANSALSIGRLDQLLQPCFANDMKQARSKTEKDAVIKRSIELVGNLFIRFNDHDPMIPNVGNKLFGGSSSDDTVTVGGVDRDGENAVCDMTYIILKAGEMLCFQDPNLNARYYPGVNSKQYLRRLCEVNVNMYASPIIHNDKAMIESLVNQGFSLEDAREWGATGCVEPTICGRHYGHTNCMLLNMVAPLEIALNNGVHPVMGEQIGPQTGNPGKDFTTFQDFLTAYKIQLTFLAEKSIEINDLLGKAHQYIHPTPLLSSMFRGPMEKGQDIINGGATYNSSGVALVSITDVVDSLMVIKKLVYEEKTATFDQLLEALAQDFKDSDSTTLLARINRVPKFGSGDAEAVALARELMDDVYDLYQPRTNYRGGPYLPGYWSISYHVGFGMLSGALPSGRRKGKAFTPGLTPAPGASDNLLDNVRSVAALDHNKMPNNIAFNVKVMPGAEDSHAETLDRLTGYLTGYFESGGLQWQFNIISTETMKDAMENPDDYRWLLVRISGYNAYFVKLNRNMQMELIERTQYAV